MMFFVSSGPFLFKMSECHDDVTPRGGLIRGGGGVIRVFSILILVIFSMLVSEGLVHSSGRAGPGGSVGVYGRGGAVGEGYFSVISNNIDIRIDDDVHVTVLSQSCLLSCIPVGRQTVLKISTKKQINVFKTNNCVSCCHGNNEGPVLHGLHVIRLQKTISPHLEK